MSEADLIRCLRVVAMTNEDRLVSFNIPRRKPSGSKVRLSDEGEWFLEHIDDLAPELHRRGWVEYAEFTNTPGQVVVTNGRGDVQAVVATEFGRKKLTAVLS